MSRSLPGLTLASALCAALLLVPLAGCHAGKSAPQPDTAVVSAAQEPDSLDPFASSMNVTWALSSLFYAGLVNMDDQGHWIPDLAERVPSLANGDVVMRGKGMRVTFHLRPSLQWEDGQPLTAADAVATWKLVMDPHFPSLSTTGYDLITRVSAPSPRTVVMDFKVPYAPFLELFPCLLPAHVIQRGAQPAREAWTRQPIASGPYRLARWISGDRLIAEANPRYYRGKPGVARIEVRFVPQENTAFAMWRAGELDLYPGAPPTQYDALQREGRGHLALTPNAGLEHLVFNLDQPILKDLAVRRAIAHLIDRQGLDQKAYANVLIPAWSEVPTFSWAYDPTVERSNPYDPAVAARLLDQSGWHPGPDGIRVKDGRTLSLTLLTTADKPSRDLAAQIWRQQWRQVGIDLAIDRETASTVFGSYASGGRLATGHYDLALIASTARPDPDTSYRWRSDQLPPAGQNRARYRSPVADHLLLDGQRTVDPEKRRAIYHALAERLSTDLPFIPLLYWVEVDANSTRLQGFRPNPTLRGIFWNVWDWKLRPSP